MVSFCVECGAKVEQNFKFCPNCGSEINLSNSSKSSSESASTSAQVIICKSCGDENSLDSKVCHSCGVRLDNSIITNRKSEDTSKVASQPRVEKSKPKKQGKSPNKTKNEPMPIVEKKLEGKKIFGLIGAGAAVVVIILMASGVFDISSNKTVPREVIQQDQSSGIDLGSISKINELKDIVEKNPENASVILDLANLRFDSGFYEDAAKNYDQYLRLDPKNANARIDMAVCYYNMQQFDKAEAEILTALKYSPNHQTGYLNLGVINLAKQNLEKSKEWFTKAVEVDPNSEIGKKAKSLLESH